MERDLSAVVKKYPDMNFNSHAHVERDVQVLILTVFMVISTHTLTWSVTRP